ncbi:hypothetical protein M1R55_24085 (plasmid) [Deinococcus sp. QL22]|nr:hypothetical protein [Deinococcus sp. QL22]UQN09125.1 hypothetical protein M1R55_24085 [Deinococcus sp. QL22]
MSGLELLRVMKADAQLKFIPVVMLTPSVAAQDVAQAYALFANSYVVKPVELSSFFQQVKSFVEFWTRTRLPNWPTLLPLRMIQPPAADLGPDQRAGHEAQPLLQLKPRPQAT